MGMPSPRRFALTMSKQAYIFIEYRFIVREGAGREGSRRRQGGKEAGREEGSEGRSAGTYARAASTWLRKRTEATLPSTMSVLYPSCHTPAITALRFLTPCLPRQPQCRPSTTCHRPILTLSAKPSARPSAPQRSSASSSRCNEARHTA
jgi:hypothetical protein